RPTYMFFASVRGGEEKFLPHTYRGYRTKTPAPVGSLGPGWKMPADIRLQLRDNTLILSDNGGRSLYFEHL
ncbi:DUF6531 domain-containing protein, partial [Escherichia coli]|uniref:DUF6531 domain-containing protein n=1 Tax=Escherichia coli TaxID=562 RepID=UPI003D33FC4A